jgi:hypothetical protein
MTLAAIISTSTHGCAPVNGRSSSTQPSGVNHRSHPSPFEVSATTRNTNETTTTAPPNSSASRRVGATWLATAPTPAYTGITETIASARYAAPPASRLAISEPANAAAHRRNAPAATANIDPPNSALRETLPARTSSARPESSSARSARTAASRPKTAASTDRIPAVRQALYPPAVRRSRACP